MAVSHEALGNVSPETWVPEAKLETFLPDKTRDNVGSPDFAVLAERSSLTPDTRPAEELHGFAAYHKDGGIFSEGLYETIMVGVIELQKPGIRENSKFTTGTESQIKGFEDRYNKPFPATLPRPKKEFFLLKCLFFALEKDFAHRLL